MPCFRAQLSCPAFVPCFHVTHSCHAILRVIFHIILRVIIYVIIYAAHSCLASMPNFRALPPCPAFVPCFHAILRVALLRIEFLHTNELILLREFDFLHQIGL